MQVEGIAPEQCAPVYVAFGSLSLNKASLNLGITDVIVEQFQPIAHEKG